MAAMLSRLIVYLEGSCWLHSRCLEGSSLTAATFPAEAAIPPGPVAAARQQLSSSSCSQQKCKCSLWCAVQHAVYIVGYIVGCHRQ